MTAGSPRRAHQLQGAHLSTPRLPSRGPIFCVLYGSFMIHVLADFRTRGLFSAFWTEVSYPVPLRTSVPGPRFRHFVRKFHDPCACRLPYPRPVFGVLYGSFLSCTLADFRTNASFSAFCTEVSCPVPLLTSVPKACFLCFGRKFSAQPAYRLPSSGPVFCISDGIFGHAKGQDFLPRPCA